MKPDEELTKVEFIIPKSLEKEITEKICQNMKDSYWWDVTKKLSEEIFDSLKNDGFMDRVSVAVLEKIKISESDYVESITENVKDSLMKTTSVITNEVLNKVQEKVKSYGFIQIGR